MSVPIRHSVSPVAVALAGLAIVIVIALLGLIYSEQRYRDCLAKVDLQYPVAYNPGGSRAGGPGLDLGTPPFFAFYPDKDQRNQAISDCSRLPF